MIRAYDEYGNIIDLVEWEKQIRANVIGNLMEKASECFISDADWNYLVQEAEQLKGDVNNDNR